MKKILLSFFIGLTFCNAFAQNAGIGNTNPLYPLDILKTGGGYILRLVNPSATTGSSSGLLFTNTTAYNTTGQNYSASILAVRQGGGGQALTFNNNQTSAAPVERMRIDSAGNIGIGTASPLYDLHISRTNPSVGFFDVDDNHYSGVIEGDSTDLLINAYRKPNTSNGGGHLILQTNGSTGIVTTGAGNVGIGTSSPTAKLHVSSTVMIGSGSPASGYLLSVNGKIIAEEVRVELDATWPDYVFAKHYDLPSLTKLEKFISTHKHLPNIPSAGEIKQEGVNLGDMNRRLLEKIEELTLYILQQDKKINVLQDQVRVIQSKF